MGSLGNTRPGKNEEAHPRSTPSRWARHPRAIQTVAVAALILGGAYLIWRIGWSGRGVDLALYLPLLAAEIFGWVSLAFYVFLAWSAPRSERPPLRTAPPIDVFVCTYDEPVHVVEPTLVGCRAITVPHETYLLDDGNRLEMAELAARLGAHYVTRPDNSHAKAGNINHALGVTHGELILMLDADHVPFPDILDATAAYFENPEVALVQTPHDFSNRDSVQHTKVQRHEQSLFYEVIAPNKDRHNSMFWCGSATLVRRTALEEVGGVLTDTVAEDFHTTIAMHVRGWTTRYHDEVLVQGLAPHDLAGFLLQRARWARGNLGVFRTKENPLTCRGLRFKQRLSYFASLFNYFSAAQRLTLLLVLSATLLTGELPMRASFAVLLALWLPWSVMAFIATVALSRGTLGPLDSTRYGLLTMGINLRAMLSLLRPGAGTFKVTPKEGIDEGGLPVLRMLGLCTTVGVFLLGVWVLRVLDVAEVISLPAMPEFATAIVIALGLWEIACILRTLVPLVRRRQLRARYRTAVDLAAQMVGTTDVVEIVDLTPDGLAFDTAIGCAPGAHVRLETVLVDAAGEPHTVVLPVEVVASRAAPGGRKRRASCRLEHIDRDLHELLVEYCDIVVAAQKYSRSGAPSARRPRDELAARRNAA
jgi:cellulose synthase (UDP-forming)